MGPYTDEGIYIGVHFNDGPTANKDEVGPCTYPADAKACHGFLEAYYAVTNETFFSGLNPTHADEPYAQVWRTDGDEAAAALDTAHAALVEVSR